MSELWGFQAGQQQAQQDQQRQQLANLSMAEGQQNLEVGGIKLQMAKLGLMQQQEMMKKLQAIGGGPGGGDVASQQAQMLNLVGGMALESGKTVEGARALAAASTIVKNDAATKTAQAKIETDKIDTALSVIESAPNLQTATMLYMQKYHEPIPPEIMKLAQDPQIGKDPKVLENIRQALLSQKDKIGLLQKQAVINKDVAETALAKKTALLRDKQIEGEDKLAKHRAKAGVSPAKEVPSWALQGVVDQVHAALGNSADIATIRGMSRGVAQNAAVYASQGLLSQQQAIDKAVKDGMAAHVWAGIKLNTPELGSKEKPIPLSQGTKPQTNRYYLSPTGKVGLWNGKQMVIVEQ